MKETPRAIGARPVVAVTKTSKKRQLYGVEYHCKCGHIGLLQTDYAAPPMPVDMKCLKCGEVLSQADWAPVTQRKIGR